MTKQVYIDIYENFNNSFYSVLHWLSPPTLYLSPLPYVQDRMDQQNNNRKIKDLRQILKEPKLKH